MTPDQWNCITYFSKEEMMCRCGCGQADMDYRFMLMLDNGRKTTGFPWILSSGFRCKKHNKAIGGAKASYHMQGIAADITVAPHRLNTFLNYAFAPDDGFLTRRFKGIGVSLKGRAPFVHVDTRTGVPPGGGEAFWVY